MGSIRPFYFNQITVTEYKTNANVNTMRLKHMQWFQSHTSSFQAQAQVRPEGKYSSIGSLVSFKRPLQFVDMLKSEAIH